MGETARLPNQSSPEREREREREGMWGMGRQTRIYAHNVYIQYAISIFYYTNLPDDIIPAGKHQND